MKTGGWVYSPGVDGYFLTEKVRATYAAGKQAHIPLLGGWNSSEMGMTVAMNPQKPTAASFSEQVQKQFGDVAAAALKVYPAGSDAEALESAAALASDMFISYSTWKWIEVHAETARSPVYRYRFDRVLPEANGSNRFGAAHAVEIEYAFNTLDSKKADWQPEDRKAADTLANAFANFVKTGRSERSRGPPLARVREDPSGDVRRRRQPGRARAASLPVRVRRLAVRETVVPLGKLNASRGHVAEQVRGPHHHEVGTGTGEALRA